ncbi:MAG: Crp/Fnr family transcriptional regulator [Thalassobius sp.]|nr:Crp/Fnr family transcriptional regulator [Thalassovita sp.]
MEELLKEYFPVFSDLELRNQLLNNAKLEKFETGDLILKQGSYIHYIPLLISGSVKVVREDEEGHEIFLYYIKPGESCALSFSAYMNHRKSEVKAICDEDTQLILIPSRMIDGWLQAYPSWQQFALQLYDIRFAELLNTVESVAFKKMDERLIEYLKEKLHLQQTDILHITHHQIATDLATSREVISRLLKQLENKGMIKISRNSIKIIGFM